MEAIARVRSWFTWLLASLIIAACGGGGGGGSGSPPPAPPAPPAPGVGSTTQTVGGQVSGLAGAGLALQINGGNDVTPSNGAFVFPAVSSGSSYNVTVAAQPANPTQTCGVANGSGTVANANITNVQISCATNAFKVLGNVSGLSGSGLILQNNGAGNLAIGVNGLFEFTAAVQSGGAYNVTVAAHPLSPTQNCTVTNGAGTIGGANVTNVAVSCVTVVTPPTTFTIGGAVAGLATGAGLTLRNNGTNILVIGANGSFAFSTGLVNAAPYNVTITNQPTSPPQVCTVVNGSGFVPNANVSNVTINCAPACVPAGCTVGGTITGLTASGLMLANGGDDLSPAAGSSAFAFPTPFAQGISYAVRVKAQPPGQTCSVSNATGSVGSLNVTSVLVRCRGYSAFSPTVTGFVSELLVTSGGTLVDNSPSSIFSGHGDQNMALTSDGQFAYVANRDDNTVAQFRMSVAGDLLRLSPVTVSASAPYGVAISRDDKYVYVTDQAHGAILQFAIGASGTLTPLSPASVSVGANPWEIAVSPDGRYVYTVNAGGNSVSQLGVGADGTLTALSPASVSTLNFPSSIAISPDGRYAYVGYSDQSLGVISQFGIDASGVLTPLSPATVATGIATTGIAVSIDSKYVYVSNFIDNVVSQYSVGVGGALLPLVPATVSTGASSQPAGIGLSPDGLFAYVAERARGRIAQFSIGTGGALAPLSPPEIQIGSFPAEFPASVVVR